MLSGKAFLYWAAYHSPKQLCGYFVFKVFRRLYLSVRAQLGCKAVFNPARRGFFALHGMCTFDTLFSLTMQAVAASGDGARAMNFQIKVRDTPWKLSFLLSFESDNAGGYGWPDGQPEGSS
jgi:hypothetical protein